MVRSVTGGKVNTNSRRSALLERFRDRPWWINLLWLFCLYMACAYLPFDIFLKPISEDREVWFGVALSGWWAKATEPVHWIIYALGVKGFWGMRRWMWPWAAVYTAQIAFGMLVWNLFDVRGRGWPAGAILAVVFMVPAVALWRAKPLFVS
jgi:hypothetical protein